VPGHQREQGQAADGGVQPQSESPAVDPRELRQLQVVRLLLCEGQPAVAHFAATPTTRSIAAGPGQDAETGHEVAAGAGVVRFPRGMCNRERAERIVAAGAAAASLAMLYKYY